MNLEELPSTLKRIHSEQRFRFIDKGVRYSLVSWHKDAYLVENGQRASADLIENAVGAVSRHLEKEILQLNQQWSRREITPEQWQAQLEAICRKYHLLKQFIWRGGLDRRAQIQGAVLAELRKPGNENYREQQALKDNAYIEELCGLIKQNKFFVSETALNTRSTALVSDRIKRLSQWHSEEISLDWPSHLQGSH